MINLAVPITSYNNLNQLTGQSAGGKMVFQGTLSEPGTVTVGGTPATVDASNNFSGTATVTAGTNDVPIIAQDYSGNAHTNVYRNVIAPASGSYTYDYCGNLLTDGTRTFTWDAKNELVKIVYTGGTSTEFTYNGTGARVKIIEKNSGGTVTSTKQFIGNEERDANNVTTRRYFAQGEQRIVSGTPTNYFYTRDHLGSIRELMGSNGTTIHQRYAYDPYGRRTVVTGGSNSNDLTCDFGFTGHYWHAASGLYLSPTRAYDPNLGRWIARDPSGEGSGLNLYAYCGGNPVCLTDPSGLCPMDDPPPEMSPYLSPNPPSWDPPNTDPNSYDWSHGNPFDPDPDPLGDPTLAPNDNYTLDQMAQDAQSHANAKAALQDGLHDTSIEIGLMAMPAPVKVGFGLTFTGRAATSVAEQMTMRSAVAGNGTAIMTGGFGDALYQGVGWVKMQVVGRGATGNITVHYMMNTVTGQRGQFKFVYPP